MIRILFICHGNICRSPMAEYIMKHLAAQRGLSEEFEIASAATSREEIGNGVYFPAQRKLREQGIPCGDHRAVQVTRGDYARYDYLIIMDENNRRNLMRIVREDPQEKIHMLMSFAGKNRSVADPWYTGDFDAAYQDIYEGCAALLQELLGE
ncbi:MAG: low molecular weight protein-tyrosine-phosphatase [Butyricicoccaceae bacterium]